MLMLMEMREKARADCDRCPSIGTESGEQGLGGTWCNCKRFMRVRVVVVVRVLSDMDLMKS